jgi:hypothetical protein
MLFGNSLYWYGGRTCPPIARVIASLSSVVSDDTVFEPPRLLARCLRGAAAVPCPCSVILRHDAVDAERWIQRAVHRCECVERGPRLLRQGDAARACARCEPHLGSLSRHPDSVYERAKADGLAVAARYHYLEWLRAYIETNHLGDDALRDAVEWGDGARA